MGGTVGEGGLEGQCAVAPLSLRKNKIPLKKYMTTFITIGHNFVSVANCPPPQSDSDSLGTYILHEAGFCFTAIAKIQQNVWYSIPTIPFH